MKTTYVKQEEAIARADRGGIYERWRWGGRLLIDTDRMASSGKSLKHSETEKLIAEAKAAGFKLSAREIQYRIQCARAYKTEAEIRNAIADFETWFALTQAGFPAYEVDADEPPADHRTRQERQRDAARQLALKANPHPYLPFDVDKFEPITTPLKELVIELEEQDRITAGFVATGRKRRSYLDALIEAADGDLEMTWADAHKRAIELGLIDDEDEGDDTVALLNEDS